MNEKKQELIAPCGMNCGICMSYLALKNEVPKRPYIVSYCKGCRPRDKKCAFLKKRCKKLLNHEVEFCFECEDFPCESLKHLDNKYKKAYEYPYSFIKTLKMIKEIGIEETLQKLENQHTCKKCGQNLCIHNNLCYNCDKETLATMDNYRNKK